MAYDPNLYSYRPYQIGPSAPISQPSWTWTPNGYSSTNMQQPIDALISVTGLEGAKAYQIPPNSKIVLFDSDSDTFYVKTTDAGGFPTIRSFSFVPIEQDTSQKFVEDYVPRAEFDALVQEVRNLVGTTPKEAMNDK